MKIKSKLEFISKLSRLFNKRERFQFAGILCVALLMALFQALGVASIIPFITLVINPVIITENRILYGIYSFFGFQSARSFIIASGALMLAIIIAGNLISILAIWLKTRFAWRKNHRLSSSLLNKYMSMPYSYFLRQNTADLNKNVLAEVQELTRSFLIPLLEIIIDLVVITLIFITLIIISPLATATIFTVFLILYALIYRSGFRTKLKEKGKLRLRENRGRFQSSSEALGGIKDIKVLGREKYFLDRFASHSLRFSDLVAWNRVIGQLPKYLIEVVAFGGVIFFILLLMITGRDITGIIPMVSFFAFAGYRIMPVTNRMVLALTNLQFNRAVLDKIYGDLTDESRESTVKEVKREDIEPLEFNDKITFKDLSYSYPGSSGKVLEKINISIKKNTSIALAGPTGAGKTTFVDIALGLLTPTEGKMLVDGIEIRGDNVRSWQRNLGYVPQFIYLSDDTAKKNIAFGIPEDLIDMEKVKKAAKIANIDTFIENEMPEGYDTVIGERGIRLSGGQRQRVGIARALYYDPEVLVLDEATSSLDGITEESVMKAMDNLSRLKTMIIIAHRLTTVKKCETIYLLDRGKVVAEGKYDHLMETNPQFRAMAREL